MRRQSQRLKPAASAACSDSNHASACVRSHDGDAGVWYRPDASFALPLPRDARLRRLCRELIDDPGLGHDLDAWADRIGVGRRTLTRRFRQETGLSFAAWRRRVRLLEAMTRQARGGSASRIAAAVGYGSARAFRTMARRSGVS